MKATDWKIEQLPGLSQTEQNKLKACGVLTTQGLLKRVKTPQLKQVLANELQLNIKYINKWVALADLARVPSVGCDYCGLILHAGIASVTQLSQTLAPRLHRQILKLQVATMQRNDLCPPITQVQQWVKEARSLSSFEL